MHMQLPVLFLDQHQTVLNIWYTIYFALIVWEAHQYRGLLIQLSPYHVSNNKMHAKPYLLSNVEQDILFVKLYLNNKLNIHNCQQTLFY